MASSFKEDQSEINFFSSDINMLLMVEKGIRGGMCHCIHRYEKANNKHMKDGFIQAILMPVILHKKLSLAIEI